MGANTQDVTLFDDDDLHPAVVKENSTSSDLPVGASGTPGIVIVGGVQSGTPDTYRALSTNAEGNLDVTIKSIPTSDPATTVWEKASVTTTATTANQTVVQYQVPTGYDFYIASYQLNKITINGINGEPIRLRVTVSGVTTDFDVAGLPGAVATPVTWSIHLGTAIKIAEPGNTVTLTVTPSGTTSTSWFGILRGILVLR